jgi:D-alanyl-D-alanine dipeptidase
MNAELPPGFVRLKTVCPSIIQDIRYFTDNNFVGRRIDGYEAN